MRARPRDGHEVTFTSTRITVDEGYGAMADRMVELARQPGYLGVESTRGPDGLGITHLEARIARVERAHGGPRNAWASPQGDV